MNNSEITNEQFFQSLMSSYDVKLVTKIKTIKINKVMKLSNKQRNRIEEYITYGSVYPLSNDYETLKTILNDGKIKSSHHSLLEEVEGRYKMYVETDWEDLENGGFISGKDYAEGNVDFQKYKK